MTRQNFIGLVTGHGKMAKTIRVSVQRPTFHKKVHKQIMSKKTFLVHDEGELAKTGDVVRIEACRPMSALKRYALAEIRIGTGQKLVELNQVSTEDADSHRSPFQQEVDRMLRAEKERARSRKIWADLKYVTRHQFAHGYRSLGPEEIAERGQKAAKIAESHGWTVIPPPIQLLSTQLNQDLQDVSKNLDNIIEKIQEEDDYIRSLGKDPLLISHNMYKNIIKSRDEKAATASAQ
ncbi:hypothetical protein CANCADRAFT_113337 [Tortispora caseinolytica NRRL Y-17796]|uniref:30S ribosomal protein S17 n=1 Tax=Tortispora caseinolytica NRRL Y-17796 TaxID=767744 RepID=A0A1E4TGS2_9ASCO|nr:hypothetical protein CANCADRAFT_113337 [Tortispora caseinolytica NRRL Y-17796]